MNGHLAIVISVAGLACGSTALAEDACDIDRGRSLFNKCAVCHTNAADADQSVGPNLFEIIDRAVAASPDYFFTEELKAYGDKWSLELLDKFLKSPTTEVPGTTMAFAGFRKEADRKNLLCFLAASENTAPGGEENED
jgi:cytochrome c